MGGTRPRRSEARRGTALVVTAAFAFVFGGCSRVAPIAPPPQSSVPPPVLAQRYADAAAAIAADRYDLDARAADLPAGVDAAFAVARDEIGAQSYSGALLGANGAYETRAANSVDRAQLLARLLTAKHVPVRYASCRLDASAAETLATQLFAEPRVRVRATPVVHVSGDDSAYARIRDRGERDLFAVKTALGGVPAFAGTPHAALIAELEEHTWLQARSGADWVDLDPSFADAVPGKRYCAPAATTDALPDAAHQTVTIRVGAETLDAGSLVENVLLDRTFAASTLRDRPIYIAQTPAKVAFDVGFGDPSRYAPVLAFDGDVTPGKPVRFADGPSGTGGAGPALADRIANALAPATPSDASPPPATGPYLVAEWLEFTVTLPDGTSDTSRRFLFDRGGPAWRASERHDAAKLAPMRGDEHGPYAAQSAYALCVTAGRHDVRAYDEGLATLVKTLASFAAATPTPASASASAPAPAPSGSHDDDPDLLTAMWPFWLQNVAVAMVGDERVIPDLNDRPDVRFYVDSPRIFVFGVGVDPASGEASLTTDLRRDPLRAIAAGTAGAHAVAEGILRFGLMEGAVETEIAELPQSQRVAGDSFGSTSELLGPDGLTVVRPGADLGGATDSETAARLRAALETGATLVVPSQVFRGGPSGWWEIARDGSRVRAVFEDLGGVVGKGPVRITPGGYARGPKSYDVSNFGKRKPNFEFTRQRPGGSEYSALIVAVAVVSTAVIVWLGSAVYKAVTTKALPELQK